MWEACQRSLDLAAIAPFGKHDIKDTRGLYSIFPKGFIKITHPEQQQSIRIFILDGIVLLHQRGGFFGFSGCQDLVILIPANVLIPVFYLQFKIRLLSKIIHRLYITLNKIPGFYLSNFIGEHR